MIAKIQTPFLLKKSTPSAFSQASSEKEENSLLNKRPETTLLKSIQTKANQGTRNKDLITIQQKADQFSAKNSIQRKPNKTGLPDQLKSGVESLSGHSMDDVKVHYNSDKPAQLNAHAYAQGTDIHLASGQEKHLPHEAWHVVQQKEGRVKPTLQMKGKVNINDDQGLEKEADLMGAKAMQMKTDQNKVPENTTPFQRKLKGSTNIIQRQLDEEAINAIASFLEKKGIIKLKENDFKKEKSLEDHLKGYDKKTDLPKIDAKLKELRTANRGEDKKGEETTDISAAYNVKRGCALQALEGHGTTAFGQSTAAEMHTAIWTEPKNAAYKEYDLDKVWKAIYKNVGLTQVHAGTKNIEDLPKGNYIVETAGHMMAVSIDKKGTVTLHQDRGNAIGKETDKIIGTYQ